MDGPVAQREWPLVARQEELGLLTEAVAAGAATPSASEPVAPAGAIIFAEAGVGKTRLMREAVAMAADRGHPTAWTTATRSSAMTPFSALVPVVPEARLDGHDAALSLHRAFAEAVAARYGSRRLVLAVDDAQLLDNGSAGLLLSLVLSQTVTLLATVRLGEPVDDAVTILWKDGLCRRLDLPPFAPAEIGDLVRRALGGDMAQRDIERLVRVSAGNALFTRELVLAAIDTGSLREVDGIWRWDGRVPLTPRLVDVVSQRLEGLTAEQRTALGLVAIGDPLPLPVAEKVTDVIRLAGLEGAGLLRIEEQTVATPSGAIGPTVTPAMLRLGHPLYGEILLGQLGAVETRRLMRTVADAVESQPSLTADDAMRIASWRLEAGGDVTAEALLAAAATADRRFDNALAERLARGSLERGGGPPAAIAVARAANGQNRFDAAEAVLADVEDAVLATDDWSASGMDLRRAYLAARSTALFHGLSRPDEALAMLDRMAARHRDKPTLHHVAGYRTRVLIDGGRLQEAVELADEVLDDPDVDDTSVLLCASTKSQALIDLGLTRSAAPLHERLNALGAEYVPGLGQAGIIAALQSLQCQYYDGRATELISQLQMYDDMLAATGDEGQRGLVWMSLGLAQLLRGTPVSARRTLRSAVATLSAWDFAGNRAWALAMLAQAEALSGDVVSARRARQASREIDVTGRIVRYDPDFVTADALIAVADGHLTRAAEIAAAGAAVVGEPHVNRARLLHLALRLGAAPAEIAGQLVDVAAVTECDLPTLYHAHAAGLASGDGVALESLVDEFESRGMWLVAAEVAAQASAAHARAAVRAGAARTAARSRSLAMRCEGARTPALTLENDSTAAALSRREREVAHLAATGLTNLEIAQQLSLSVRTVESHLYQSFAKLGISHREDLSGVLGVGPAASPENQ
ncbi:helix-turn-helix transcriptional regulator [Intrasporangium sp.]|uniref:helix-turn-helix transcriptional regulator n=1 Tax=Intrasporangium sp. TaxID=1925024 RepID=UPI00293B869E|nr:LuxR C-terminal-related transcriptional regulator [Intrasporangium sp.]MDV3222751.1 LuxR C-terminal-related transcriptional regulator [Intrasporangium sp.]